MPVETHRLQLDTRGNAQVIDITPAVSEALASGTISDAIVCVSVIGSTASITTTEFEPGLANHDLAALFGRLAPENDRYVHEETWHDDNGHSHCRASLVGPSITVPLVNARLALGTWQQIVLLDFDTRGRSREVVVQVVGE